MGREEMKTSIVKIVLNPVIWTITKTNPRFQDRIILPEIIMMIKISCYVHDLGHYWIIENVVTLIVKLDYELYQKFSMEMFNMKL